MRVAIIDDETVVCHVFAEILKTENHQPRCFHTAEAFLESDQVTTFDCMLVDFRLPGKNGIEMIRLLRARGITTPAVVISGNMDDEFDRAIASLDKIETLRKPCQATAILEKVRKVKLTIAPSGSSSD